MRLARASRAREVERVPVSEATAMDGGGGGHNSGDGSDGGQERSRGLRWITQQRSRRHWMLEATTRG